MKYALITGGGSGLGRASVLELAKLGYGVFACDINTDNIQNVKNVTPIIMDVTNDESIANALKVVTKTTKTLDLVANFAGIVGMGSLIEQDVNVMKKMFDINLFGMYRVNKTFFELIKKGKGRYINISSECGIFPAPPFNTFYTATKHAVEMYNDGLRRELLAFNIPVVNIRPGAFKTNMQGGVNAQFEKIMASTKYYKNAYKRMEYGMNEELNNALDTSVFVKTFMMAVNDKQPKIVYEVNISEKMRKTSVIPAEMLDQSYKQLFM